MEYGDILILSNEHSQENPNPRRPAAPNTNNAAQLSSNEKNANTNIRSTKDGPRSTEPSKAAFVLVKTDGDVVRELHVPMASAEAKLISGFLGDANNSNNSSIMSIVQLLQEEPEVYDGFSWLFDEESNSSSTYTVAEFSGPDSTDNNHAIDKRPENIAGSSFCAEQGFTAVDLSCVSTPVGTDSVRQCSSFGTVVPQMHGDDLSSAGDSVRNMHVRESPMADVFIAEPHFKGYSLKSSCSSPIVPQLDEETMDVWPDCYRSTSRLNTETISFAGVLDQNTLHQNVAHKYMRDAFQSSQKVYRLAEIEAFNGVTGYTAGSYMFPCIASTSSLSSFEELNNIIKEMMTNSSIRSRPDPLSRTVPYQQDMMDSQNRVCTETKAVDLNHSYCEHHINEDHSSCNHLSPGIFALCNKTVRTENAQQKTCFKRQRDTENDVTGSRDFKRLHADHAANAALLDVCPKQIVVTDKRSMD